MELIEKNELRAPANLKNSSSSEGAGRVVLKELYSQNDGNKLNANLKGATCSQTVPLTSATANASSATMEIEKNSGALKPQNMHGDTSTNLFEHKASEMVTPLNLLNTDDGVKIKFEDGLVPTLTAGLKQNGKSAAAKDFKPTNQFLQVNNETDTAASSDNEIFAECQDTPLEYAFVAAEDYNFENSELESYFSAANSRHATLTNVEIDPLNLNAAINEMLEQTTNQSQTERKSLPTVERGDVMFTTQIASENVIFTTQNSTHPLNNTHEDEPMDVDVSFNELDAHSADVVGSSISPNILPNENNVSLEKGFKQVNHAKKTNELDNEATPLHGNAEIQITTTLPPINHDMPEKPDISSTTIEPLAEKTSTTAVVEEGNNIQKTAPENTQTMMNGSPNAALNVTLELNTSMNSCNSNKSSPHTHSFPIKENEMPAKQFPRSPTTALAPKSVPFLEKSEYTERIEIERKKSNVTEPKLDAFERKKSNVTEPKFDAFERKKSNVTEPKLDAFERGKSNVTEPKLDAFHASSKTLPSDKQQHIPVSKTEKDLSNAIVTSTGSDSGATVKQHLNVDDALNSQNENDKRRTFNISFEEKEKEENTKREALPKNEPRRTFNISTPNEIFARTNSEQEEQKKKNIESNCDVAPLTNAANENTRKTWPATLELSTTTNTAAAVGRTFNISSEQKEENWKTEELPRDAPRRTFKIEEEKKKQNEKTYCLVAPLTDAANENTTQTLPAAMESTTKTAKATAKTVPNSLTLQNSSCGTMPSPLIASPPLPAVLNRMQAEAEYKKATKPTGSKINIAEDGAFKVPSPPQPPAAVTNSSPPLPTMLNRMQAKAEHKMLDAAAKPTTSKVNKNDDGAFKMPSIPPSAALTGTGSSPPVPAIQKRPSIHAYKCETENAFVAEPLSAKEQKNSYASDDKDVFAGNGTPSPMEELPSSTCNFDDQMMDVDQQGVAADEEFHSSEDLIFNPSDFDYLLSKGNNNATIDRSSLLLKFDPLLGVAVPVNQVKKQQQPERPTTKESQPRIQQILENKTINLSPFHSTSSASATSAGGGSNQSFIVDFDNCNNKRKTFNIAAPAANEKSGDNKKINQTCAKNSIEHNKQQQHKAKEQQCQEQEKILKNYASMSVDVINKDMNIDNDCNNKSFENTNIKLDEKQINYKMDEIEKKIKNEGLKTEDIEKKLKEAEQREEALIKRITDKEKTITKMNGVIEAYEKAIAELIAEKEQLAQNYEKQLIEAITDRDDNYRHLTSLETTFADLHVKYGKSKEMTMQLKANEEALIAERRQMAENLRLQEQRYDKMKTHAMQQLEIANKKLESLNKEHVVETTKLKALLKKEEISRSSINEQLQQKTRENEELVKICDELINGQGS